MAKSVIKKQAIWWAVDPFHDDEAFHNHAIRVLAPFARALGTVIHPVTFIDTYRALEPEGQWLPLLALESAPLDALKNIATERLTRLSKAHKQVLSSPIILTHDSKTSSSLRERVDAISAEAEKHSAVFVALHSHSRSGLKRFEMGSFAETFMLYSKVPVLVFNPKCSVSSKIRRVVFPTDFSLESLHACRAVRAICQKARASLSIAHVEPWYFSLKQSYPQMQGEIETQKRQNVRSVEALAAKVRKFKVKADAVILADSSSHSPSTAILNFAKRNKADLIALAAQSGPIRTFLVGATSRETARAAQCPVLIYRTETE